MKINKAVLFVVILLFAFLPLLNIPSVQASVSDSWLFDDLTFRKEHNLTGSSAGNQTDYQMNVTVDYGSGSDSAWTVYVDGETQPDFDDVRWSWYNQSSGLEEEMDYWLEGKTDGVDAKFWFETPLIHNLTSSNNTIYMYYNNSDVSSTSNGKNTFPYFYDFNTDESGEWTQVVGAWNWDTTNGWLQLTTSTESLVVITGATASFKAYRSRVRPYRTGAQIGMAPSIVFAYANSSNYYMSRIHESANEVQFYKKVSNSFTKLAGVATTINDKQWYISEVKWFNVSHVEVYTDGVENVDQTANLESWTTGGVGFRHYYSRSDFDWYLVRNLCDPDEPYHGDWGSVEALDVIAPTFSHMGINQTYAGNVTYFYCNVTDTAHIAATPGLSGSILNTNNSGTSVNQSWRAIGGAASAIANDSLALNDTVGVVIAFFFIVNDTSNNNLTTQIFTFVVDENASGGVGGPAVVVPNLVVFNINNTLAGNDTLIIFTFNISSGSLSHGIIETNNSGTPTNLTWYSLTGVSDSFNESLTLNSTIGTNVYFKGFCNSSAKVWAEETQVIVLSGLSTASDYASRGFIFATIILMLFIIVPVAIIIYLRKR